MNIICLKIFHSNIIYLYLFLSIFIYINSFIIHIYANTKIFVFIISRKILIKFVLILIVIMIVTSFKKHNKKKLSFISVYMCNYVLT